MTRSRHLALSLALAAWAIPAVTQAAAGDGDRGVLQARPGFRDALTAPLHDLNLAKTDIPDVLLRAKAAPYSLDGLSQCEGLAAEVGRIDSVLGRDLDEPPPPDGRSRASRAASQAHGAAVDAVEDRSRGLLPFRGWIRKLTGAEGNDKALQAAIRAGEVRRGYLKGVGMRMNCAPPAAPSWFIPKTPPAKAHAPPASARPMWRIWWDALVDWLRRLVG